MYYVALYIIYLILLLISIWFLLSYTTDNQSWIFTFFAVGILISIIGIFLTKYFWVCVTFYAISFIFIIIGIILASMNSNMPSFIWYILGLAIILSIIGNMLITMDEESWRAPCDKTCNIVCEKTTCLSQYDKFYFGIITVIVSVILYIIFLFLLVKNGPNSINLNLTLSNTFWLWIFIAVTVLVLIASSLTLPDQNQLEYGSNDLVIEGLSCSKCLPKNQDLSVEISSSLLQNEIVLNPEPQLIFLEDHLVFLS